jgi:prepilin-type N-terminal cleavage/methylation domain-containing protein
VQRPPHIPFRRRRPGLRSPEPVLAAFSLAELLVVMAIIALLATIGLPALRGIGRGNALKAATRQLLDDLSLARLRAINARTTVYVVFVPTNIAARLAVETDLFVRRQVSNLVTAPYSGYALVTKRTVGDQPGREFPRYVTDWRRLPDGVLIAPYKYRNARNLNDPGREYDDGFEYVSNEVLPFPLAGSYRSGFGLPCLAFNALGQLTSGRDEIVMLAEGSVFYPRDEAGRPLAPDVEIKPPNNFTNHIMRVNWLTGRAAMERREMP